MEEFNGYNWFNRHDDYFATTIVFLPRDRKSDMLPVRNQSSTDCCASFALGTVVSAAVASRFRRLIRMSEQQICSFFNWESIGTDQAVRYIEYSGMMPYEVYPWSGARVNIPRPELPIKIYKPTFRPVKELEFVPVLFYRPIASGLYYTEGYEAWYQSGCKFIFSYPSNEIARVMECRNSSDFNVMHSLPAHAVTVVGFGREFGHDYYIVQDSYGHSINWGYRKLAPNVLLDGFVVEDVEERVIQLYDDPNFQRIAPLFA